MHPGEFNAQGSSMKFGIGYEYDVIRHMGLSLVVNYGFESFRDVHHPPDIMIENQHYDVIEFLFGITYH